MCRVVTRGIHTRDSFVDSSRNIPCVGTITINVDYFPSLSNREFIGSTKDFQRSQIIGRKKKIRLDDSVLASELTSRCFVTSEIFPDLGPVLARFKFGPSK